MYFYILNKCICARLMPFFYGLINFLFGDKNKYLLEINHCYCLTVIVLIATNYVDILNIFTY